VDRDLDAEPVRYGPRPPVPTKLDAYKPIIEARLTKYPALSAVRLFAECQAGGYTGSLTQLKVFVRQVRPRPVDEPIVRFETAPGHQAQVDFAEVKLPWGKRYALVVVLGFSRLLWIRFVVRQDYAHPDSRPRRRLRVLRRRAARAVVRSDARRDYAR
jgi:transposase